MSQKESQSTPLEKKTNRRNFLKNSIKFGLGALGLGLGFKAGLDVSPISQYYIKNMENALRDLDEMSLSESDRNFFRAIITEEVERNGERFGNEYVKLGMGEPPEILERFVKFYTSLGLESNYLTIERVPVLRNIFILFDKAEILPNIFSFPTTIGPTQINVRHIQEQENISREEATNMLMIAETAILLSIKKRREHSLILRNRISLTDEEVSETTFLLAEFISWNAGPIIPMILADQLNYLDLANILGINRERFEIDGYNGPITARLVRLILEWAHSNNEISEGEYHASLESIHLFESNQNINARYTSPTYKTIKKLFKQKLNKPFRIFPTTQDLYDLRGNSSGNYALRALDSITYSLEAIQTYYSREELRSFDINPTSQ